MASRIWWIALVRGLLGIVLGLMLIVWPQESAEALVMLIGAFVVAIGLAMILLPLMTRVVGWGVSLGSGMLTLAIGLAALLAPAFVATIMIWLIAAWVIVTGVTELLGAAAARSLGADVTALWIVGAVSVLFGLVLLAWPGAGIVAAAWAIGAYFLVTGALLLWHAISTRQTVSPTSPA
ncbi:MAG TPA: hypothetical protein DEP45_08175 [Armatimonadetes bacterium]|nr:hypothetical protein [Armatimonadota bacterium]